MQCAPKKKKELKIRQKKLTHSFGAELLYFACQTQANEKKRKKKIYQNDHNHNNITKEKKCTACKQASCLFSCFVSYFISVFHLTIHISLLVWQRRQNRRALRLAANLIHVIEILHLRAGGVVRANPAAATTLQPFSRCFGVHPIFILLEVESGQKKILL